MLNIDGVHLAQEVEVPSRQHAIVFPEHRDRVLHIALDIGGSLAKLVYFTRDGVAKTVIAPPPAAAASDSEAATASGAQNGRHSDLRPHDNSEQPPANVAVEKGPAQLKSPGGRLRFARHETMKIDQTIDFLRNLLNTEYPDWELARTSAEKPILAATGGGAYKFHDRISEELGVEIRKHDEMECLVKGINFLVRHVPNEVFSYSESESVQFVPFAENDAYPYLLVNIGSGVSIIKVMSETSFERVSGTSLGGGTFWGLMSILTNNDPPITFDEMLQLSRGGKNASVDMLVGDIYGMDYGRIGLKSTTIASSFGKLFKMSNVERKEAETADLACSLLFMISNNIGQIANLVAEKHNIKRIYFGGYFICGHPITMNALSYAIRFWSKNEVRALFLRHEGFVGAMGAFLQH